MKISPLVAVGIAAAVAAASAFAADPYAGAGTGISGSRHDINAFAAKGGVANVVGDTQERVCAFCHSPHHAYTTDMQGAEAADYLPLWAHELTAKTYTGYASDSLNAIIGDPLVGPSRLCMSCHDGVIAVDTHYKSLGAPGSQTGAELIGDFFAGEANPAQSGAVGAGTSLAGDHPIGFNYVNAKTADAAYGSTFKQGINEETETYKAVGVTTNVTIKDTLWGVAGGDKVIMTCATCHEVHNKDNVVQYKSDGVTPLDVNYFLYGSQSGSLICLSCHNK